MSTLSEDLKEIKKLDPVNKPPHYLYGSLEVIDIIKDKMYPAMFEGFCVGNCLKYILRYKHKNGIEDLKKAQWYLNYIIKEG